MRSYCKHVDITETAFCERAVSDFIKGKRSRHDVQRLLERFGSEKAVAEHVARSIRERSVRLEPIHYFHRTEPTNGKVREIGKESALHQVYDYVAVNGLMELFKAKVGYWQTASIPGRGPVYAQRGIKKWVRERDARYFVKLDVRKCYPSIDRDVLMAMLEKDVRNDDLLYLVRELLAQFDKGINIGSYLSQWLANYYLSHAYHFCEQELFKERRGKRVRLITHQLWYMDDCLLMGRSKRDLKMAVRRLERYMREELHLTIKPWKVCRVGKEPIDMIGYVFYPTKTTVRPGIFLRGRRAFRKALRDLRHGHLPLHRAYRVIAYWGFFKHSDSGTVARACHMRPILEACKARVRLAALGRSFDASLLTRGAGARQLPATA